MPTKNIKDPLKSIREGCKMLKEIQDSSFIGFKSNPNSNVFSKTTQGSNAKWFKGLCNDHMEQSAQGFRFY